MSKHSKKGFRKLENHELSEFTTLHGEDSGSDSEMIEMDPENSSKRGGGLCTWCVALYLILLTCFIILLCMFGVYFGYNMMQVSSDYSQRIRSLEDKIKDLEQSLNREKTLSESRMFNMSQRVDVVNDSVLQLTSHLQTHLGEVEERVGSVEESEDDLKKRVSAFESHPPTIGQDEVNHMRSSMAEFRSHLESYDAQLSDAKKTAGDAMHEVSVVNDKVQVLRKNVTSLKSGLRAAKKDHTGTADSLDLLTTQFAALQVVVQEVNETVLREAKWSRDSVNETREEFRSVKDRLTVLADHLETVSHDVNHLNSSLKHLESQSTLPEVSSPPTAATTAATEPQNTQPTTAATTAATEPQNTQPTTAATTAATEPQNTQPTTAATTAATEPQNTTQPTTVVTTAATEPQTTQPTYTTEASTEPTTEATVATTAATVVSDMTTEPDTQASIEPTTETTAGTTVQASELTESTGAETTTDASVTPYPGLDNKQINTTVSDGGTVSDSGTVSSPTVNSVNGVMTPISSPSGIPSDSTGATEDLPASQGSRNSLSSSSSSGQGQAGNSMLEDQPPTVNEQQKYLQHTISKLQDLLVQFSILDLSEDGALDYMEFSAFAGDTESSRRIFHTMDTDGNNLLTYQEALDTLDILERQTTEGTEDIPDKTESESTDQYSEGESPITSLPTTGETAGTEYDSVAPATHQALPATEATSPVTTASADSLVDDTGSETGGEEEEEKDERMFQAWKTLSALLDKFVLLDTNHDGYLSSYEFAVYFPEDNPVVDNIFQFLDKDHDSLVTMEELVAAIDGLEREMPTVEEQDSTVDPEGELAEYLHNPDTNF